MGAKNLWWKALWDHGWWWGVGHRLCGLHWLWQVHPVRYSFIKNGWPWCSSNGSCSLDQRERTINRAIQPFVASIGVTVRPYHIDGHVWRKWPMYLGSIHFTGWWCEVSEMQWCQVGVGKEEKKSIVLLTSKLWARIPPTTCPMYWHHCWKSLSRRR